MVEVRPRTAVRIAPRALRQAGAGRAYPVPFVDVAWHGAIRGRSRRLPPVGRLRRGSRLTRKPLIKPVDDTLVFTHSEMAMTRNHIILCIVALSALGVAGLAQAATGPARARLDAF